MVDQGRGTSSRIGEQVVGEKVLLYVYKRT